MNLVTTTLDNDDVAASGHSDATADRVAGRPEGEVKVAQDGKGFFTTSQLKE